MTSIETEKVHPSDGFVVCLQTAWSGIYNIGVTKNTPEKRLKQLSTGNQSKLQLINSYESENYLKIETVFETLII